ncbi:MAG: FecR domain-containing protein [Burkholderiales bacterium]|nr:FecR domain-containing protein [Burkholderiales bacterium]
MKTRILIACVLALGAAAAPAHAQSIARILALAGTATVERAGRQQPLQSGIEVENGDLIDVGDRSALQLRFTDESVVALRANTQFKIVDYRYGKGVETDRSVLSLLRGGMRTITGLIGKANPRSYAVQTTIATLGIRGTHFTLVACNNDCTNPDGTQSANGVFGGVTDGRVSVANDAGEIEFGQQDYFQVVSAAALPLRLLAPPAILNDRALVVRARAATGVAAEGAEADSKGSRRASTQVSTSPQLVAQRLQAAAVQAIRSAVAAGEKPSLVAVLAAQTDISVVQASAALDKGVVSPTSDSRSLTVNEVKAQVEEVRDRVFYNAATLAAQVDKTQKVDGRPAAGVYWTYDSPEAGKPLGTHTAFGDTPLVSLPGSGVAVYSFAGGTAPTDNFGRTGALSAGRLGMDFQARQIKTLDAMTLQFARLSAAIPATTYAIAQGNVWNMAAGAQTLSNVQCSGCNGTPLGTINGRLVGTTLQGYAAAITVQGAVGSAGARHVVGGVATFGRD